MTKFASAMSLLASAMFIGLALAAYDDRDSPVAKQLRTTPVTPVSVRELLRDSASLEISVAQACRLNSVKFDGADQSISPVPDFGVKDSALRTMLVHCRILDARPYRAKAGALRLSIRFQPNTSPHLSNIDLAVELDGKTLAFDKTPTAKTIRSNQKNPLPVVFYYPRAIVGALNPKMRQSSRRSLFKRLCSGKYKVPDRIGPRMFYVPRPNVGLPLDVNPTILGWPCTEVAPCTGLIQGLPLYGLNVNRDGTDLSISYVFQGLAPKPTAVFWREGGSSSESSYFTSTARPNACGDEEREKLLFLLQQDPFYARLMQVPGDRETYKPFCGLGDMPPMLPAIPLYEDVDCQRGGPHCSLSVTQSWIKVDGHITAIAEVSLSDGQGLEFVSEREAEWPKNYCLSAVTQSL